MKDSVPTVAAETLPADAPSAPVPMSEGADEVLAREMCCGNRGRCAMPRGCCLNDNHRSDALDILAAIEGNGYRIIRATDIKDAADTVNAWGAYAGEYFQTKHDLAGDVARIRALGARHE